MSYTPRKLEKAFDITELYSVHYFEYSSSYTFIGEEHDFWELVYVDSGSILVTAAEESRSLSRGQLIFHPPGEFHALAANGQEAPNLVVIGFGCQSEKMDFFRDYTLFLGAAERALLGRAVEESRSAYLTPLDDPTTKSLTLAPDALPGAEQLIKAALEELLVLLYRRGDGGETREKGRLRTGSDAAEAIKDYLEQRIDQPLTVEQICRDNMIGRSQLQKLFHDETGGGIMEYFSSLKIKAARRLIREGRLNMTQIALHLGFQSVHYFSRRFKQFTGMSPSEYAESVKMLAEANEILSDNRANNL
ncbi:MAG: helix-turn-helix domain-containing protein [Oscillospiraceae bacterium]|nr:helix-turn-helix domain-containing protein [Oscillospiraceae bacterium]